MAWYWRCERFVEEAYGTRAIYDSANAAAGDVKLHHDPVTKAPRGALIYFRADRINHHLGHVGLSLGHGKMLSALAKVVVTDVAHQAYWRSAYLGWADAPVTWPGRPASVSTPLPDADIAIGIVGPGAGETISGPQTFYVAATNVSGVAMRAYYATDPRDATTRGWHDLGNATQQGNAWQLTWDTTTIPDQGQPDWGTVRVEAIALDASGQEVGNRDSRRYRVDNATDSAPPGPPPSSTTTYAETTGGAANTWSDYTTAGGTRGQGLYSNQTIQIACKVQGFVVADGNPWWYRIASSPWSNGFYVTADAFYNNGQTDGSLQGTPFVDPAVPLCS
jgi:hypothetical protein